MQQIAALRLPDGFLVEKLAAALAQGLDHPAALVEVVPEPFRIDLLHLARLVAEHVAEPRIVENEPPVLVDDEQAGRAVFQRLAKLALVLGELGLALRERGDVVDPQDALRRRRS